jgi:sentrin-specific protease 8
MIEFHMEFLERNYVPKDVKYLLLRPGMAHLITYIEGTHICVDIRYTHTSGQLGDVMQLEPVLPANMDQYQIIFIPVNDGVPQKAYSGSHWSLMVYVRAVNSFYYFDTLGSTNMNQGKIIYKRLEALLKLEHPAQFIPSSTPQQENGTDCGGNKSGYIISE